MKKLIVCAGLLLFAASAFAAPVNILLTAFQPPTPLQPIDWLLGYPYTATVNGLAGQWIMCDDWDHGGLPGQSWLANYTNLGTGNLSQLRFNQLPNAGTLYQEVGWLLLETRVQPYAQWQDINLAVWYNFDKNAAPYMTSNAYNWLQQAQNEAALGFPGVNFNAVAIYTPLNQYGTNPNGKLDPGAPQEVLQLVPEPTTILLVAGGLLGVMRRKLLP